MQKENQLHSSSGFLFVDCSSSSVRHQSPILWTKIEIEIELTASVRDRDRASKLDLDLDL
jgi:hypothetical protein